jgi:hypothetical protein
MMKSCDMMFTYNNVCLDKEVEKTDWKTAPEYTLWTDSVVLDIPGQFATKKYPFCMPQAKYTYNIPAALRNHVNQDYQTTNKLSITKTDDTTIAKTHKFEVTMKFVNQDLGTKLSWDLKIIDGCPKVTKITKPAKVVTPTYYVNWKDEKFTPPAWTTEPKTCKIDYSLDESAKDYNSEMKKLTLDKNVLAFDPNQNYLEVKPIKDSKTDEFTFKV